MLAERIDAWNEQLRQESLQKGRQEGWQEAWEQGWKEGLREGIAMALLRVLEKRFGPADPATRDRIAAADADLLLEWIDRSAVAESLADIFSD